MTLSAAQKSAVTSSWKSLAADRNAILTNGAALFSLLFKTFPDTKQHFPHFEGKGDDLKASGVGRAHALAVFTGIDAIVKSLDDGECIEGLSLKLARNHVDRKIGSSRFQQMRQVFGSFLDQQLGGAATADVKAAWDALLAFLQEHLAAEEKRR